MQQMHCKFVYVKFSQMQRLGFAAEQKKSSVQFVLF